MSFSILWHNSSSNETQNWVMDGSQIRFRVTVLGEHGQPALVGLPWRLVGTGDFDGDGNADLLWYNNSTGETQIWFMTGAAIGRRATVLAENGQPIFIGPPWSIVAVGDFNEDGFADILWHNSATGETQIWIMGVTQVASRPTVLGGNGHPALVGLPWSIVGAGDFNRDRNSDILWHNSATGETQIWFMSGSRVASRVTVLGEDGHPVLVGLPWSIVGVGDFDNDSNDDILWHNSSTGETQIWFMDPIPNGFRIRSRGTVVTELGSPILIGSPWSIVGEGLSAASLTVPAPASGLGSNSNYIISSECKPLLGLSVAIDVTQDIVWKASSGPVSGFGFQLNAYSPPSETSAWQQYVILLLGTQLMGAVDNWPITGPNIINSFFNLTNLAAVKIPAGYRLHISLLNDQSGNITGATYMVVDNHGKLLSNITQNLLSIAGVTSAFLSPIIAFELNLVGPVNSASAVLSSGAGTITYTASNLLTVLNREPQCAESGYVTAETANSVYGPLSATISETYTQSFSVSKGAQPIRKEGKPRPSLIIPRGNAILKKARIPE
jgi:hypothetical protein